jgi:hypothetical protein
MVLFDFIKYLCILKFFAMPDTTFVQMEVVLIGANYERHFGLDSKELQPDLKNFRKIRYCSC